ncbi:hypothetical protein GT346_16335, partial [Streptomyces sp. SID161]|nr:hypothetical protein [Streptomyces sp. SID161]
MRATADRAYEEEGKDMGRHRRSAAGRAATGRSPEVTHSQSSGTEHEDPRNPSAGRRPIPMGTAPYLNPEAYAEATAKASAYLFATDAYAAPATPGTGRDAGSGPDAGSASGARQDHSRRGDGPGGDRSGGDGPAGGGGLTPGDGPSDDRRRRRGAVRPVRAGLLAMSIAAALGAVAAATGVMPGLENYRFGGSHATGADRVQTAAAPGDTNTASPQGGTSGSAGTGPTGGPADGRTGGSAGGRTSAPAGGATERAGSPGPSSSASPSRPHSASPSARASHEPARPRSAPAGTDRSRPTPSRPTTPRPAPSKTAAVTPVPATTQPKPTKAPKPSTSAKPSASPRPSVPPRPSTTARPTEPSTPSSSPTPSAPATSAEPTPSRTATKAPAATSAPVTVSRETAAAAEVLKLVNDQRTTAGCTPLAANSSLTGLAGAFSDDMAARDFFAHTDPDGRTPWDRAAKAGITDLGGENIARGQADAAAVRCAGPPCPDRSFGYSISDWQPLPRSRTRRRALQT